MNNSLEKYELRLIRSNIFQLIKVNSNTLYLFIDQVQPLYHTTLFKHINYKHITNLKNTKTGKIHYGALLNFQIPLPLFNHLLYFIKNEIEQKEQYFYTDLISIFTSIEDSFKKSSYNRKKLVGLFGELFLIRETQKNGLSLNGQYQSTICETKHDFTTNNIIIEVKTTEGNHRNHTYSDLQQIDPTLYPLSGYICSVMIKKDSNGISIRSLLSQIVEHIEDAGEKIEFEKKVNFLYHKLIDNKKKYSQISGFQFIPFPHIPRPIIDDSICKIEWTANYNSIHPNFILSFEDFVQIFRS